MKEDFFVCRMTWILISFIFIKFQKTSYVDRMPQIGETLMGKKFKMGFGGKGKIFIEFTFCVLIIVLALKLTVRICLP